MQDQQNEAREDLLKKTDEELRTLMMQALASEEIDIEYINCITDILAARHPEEYTFNGDGILDAALQVGEQNSVKDVGESRPSASKRKPHTLRNMLAIAAVIAVVMTAGFVIPVHGTNLIGIIAHWTSELFSFGSSEIEKTGEDQSPLYTRSADSMVLHDLLIENGIEIPLAPTYIPEGFLIRELIGDAEDLENQKYGAEFINEVGDTITISIRTSDPINTIIEKDENSVTIYTVNHIDHYIFSNINSLSVSWRNGNYNCSIDIFSSSPITEEQTYAMIDSIYGNGE